MPVILSIEYTIAREAKEFHIVAGVADNESSRSWVDLGSVIKSIFGRSWIGHQHDGLGSVIDTIVSYAILASNMHRDD